MSPPQPGFGWGRMVRLGLVQAAPGAIVVLATSTLNRVMVVRLALPALLPALLPGVLVVLHHAVRIARPRMGRGTDVSGRHTPLAATVFTPGVANGAFSIGAIGWMMRLAGQGGQRSRREAPRAGVRMGLWGAAQALAFGLGGLLDTVASDLAQWLMGRTGGACAAVFTFEALVFVASAVPAAGVDGVSQAAVRPAGTRFSHDAAASDGAAWQPR